MIILTVDSIEAQQTKWAHWSHGIFIARDIFRIQSLIDAPPKVLNPPRFYILSWLLQYDGNQFHARELLLFTRITIQTLLLLFHCQSPQAYYKNISICHLIPNPFFFYDHILSTFHKLDYPYVKSELDMLCYWPEVFPSLCFLWMFYGNGTLDITNVLFLFLFCLMLYMVIFVLLLILSIITCL